MREELGDTLGVRIIAALDTPSFRWARGAWASRLSGRVRIRLQSGGKDADGVEEIFAS